MYVHLFSLLLMQLIVSESVCCGGGQYQLDAGTTRRLKKFPV